MFARSARCNVSLGVFILKECHMVNAADQDELEEEEEDTDQIIEILSCFYDGTP